MFEWQKHSSGSSDVPHYRDLLNLRAQASENSVSDSSKRAPSSEMRKNFKPVTAFPVNTTPHMELEDAQPNFTVLATPRKRPFQLSFTFVLWTPMARSMFQLSCQKHVWLPSKG